MRLSKLQRLLDSGELSPADLDELGQSRAGRLMIEVAASSAAESAADEVEQRFRVLADTAPVLVWQTDEAGAVFMNQEYRNFVGRSLHELLGMGWIDALHPEDAEQYVSSYLAAFGQRARFEAQFRFRRADGEYRWLQSVGLPHFQDGEFMGYVGSSFDITDIKNAEHALRDKGRWFAEIADVSPGIQWVTDALGQCTYLSRRWYELTGQTEADGLSFGWLKALHPEDRPNGEAAFQAALAARSSVAYECRIRSADGSYRWCIDHGRPRFGRDGAFLGHVGHVVDITELKRAELQGLRANKALEEANQRKDQFIATLAHELRNPLAPIQTGIQIVRRAPGSAASDKALAVMERQLTAIVRLIDDLMDVSRISSGRIELERSRVELAQVLEQARETVQPMFDAHRQRLCVMPAAAPLFLLGDPVRLVQIFTNLLSNSSRYSGDGSQVRVEVDVAADGHSVAVKVVDEGCGIPTDRLEAVFETFSTLDQELGRASRGLGIGLSLARKLVDMHAGRLWASSEGMDTGATFTVELPLIRDDLQQDEATPTSIPWLRARPLKILIVDDNIDAADTLAAELRLAQAHAVSAAHSGEEGLEKALSDRPDVAFLDIGLPDMSGYEVAQAMRQRAELADMRLIALSGWGSPEVKAHATSVGFDEHLTKPATADQIHAVLARFFPASDASSAG